MRILVFSHYFPPEVNAPASRTYEHCLRWVKAGHEVTVITCQPNCPTGVVFSGYRNSFRKSVETIDGIRVVRVWSFIAANARKLRRIANFLTYAFSAVLACLSEARPDVVLATSPQFFCGWAGVWASRFKRAPFVLEIRDIWPESIKTVGAINSSAVLRVLGWLERRMYLAADKIVTVGQGYKKRIEETAAVTGRVSVVTNGVDLEQFTVQQPDTELLERLGMKDKFVCSYIGTIGMAHGLDVVIRAARLLKDQGNDSIQFCLAGDGADRKRLQALAETEGVSDRVRFTGMLEKHLVPAMLASSDAILVHLKGKELFETVIPSKIFEAMALERPLIMGVKGESLRIVADANAAIAMVPESAESLVDAVVRLSTQPELAQRLGRDARRFVQANYDRNVLAGRVLEVLQSATKPQSPKKSSRPTPVRQLSRPSSAIASEVTVAAR